MDENDNISQVNSSNPVNSPQFDSNPSTSGFNLCSVPVERASTPSASLTSITNQSDGCSTSYYQHQPIPLAYCGFSKQGFYEMVNTASMSSEPDRMDTSGDSEGDSHPESRSSVLQAIVDINLCDIPLRNEIIEVMRSTGVFDARKPITYRDYIELETYPTLQEIENDRLEELKNACLLLRNPYSQIVNETNHLGDALKVTEAAIRRLIKMSKRLSAFNRLSQNDQISLLKSSIIEMMCIRATTSYNSENNYWYFIDDKNKGLTLISMEVLKDAQVNLNTHKNFAIKFNSQFKNDTIIADLLTAIILFRPSRATTSNQNIIRDEFLNYCFLLRRYLQIKYDGNSCKAKSAFITLMHRLEELYFLSEEIVRMYLDMDPGNAGPLFVELFDLK